MLMVPAPPLPMLDALWTVHLVRPDGADLDLVHRWMNQPHIAAFWAQDWPRVRWAAELTRQLSDVHSRPFLAERAGVPMAYLEVYWVARDPLADHYPSRPHDLGVHIAIGDVSEIGRGVGRRLLRAVADGLLAADPACTRVVAEPNAANEPALRAFRAAGYVQRGRIALPHKTAALMVRPRTEADLPEPVEPGLEPGGGRVIRSAGD